MLLIICNVWGFVDLHIFGILSRMRNLSFVYILAACALVVLPLSAHAALINQVNQAFHEIHGRDPSFAEWRYWAERVQRKEKTTYEALVGAIAYQYAHNGGSPKQTASLAPSVPSAATFAVDRNAYPSPHNPDFYPDATLIKSPSSGNVYYVWGGKRSWVLPSILNRWLGENHYFKHDIIMTISDADMARYPQRASVNPLYVGKILQAPGGQQYYIDDKLRKRPISDAVRTKLNVPANNLYPTSSAHLAEFATGPALSGNEYPGGYVVYEGPYHGGRFWKIEEIQGGKLVKRLFLSDYIYEASGYPDESQRSPVVASIFAKHGRGENIERYPDGFTVGIGNNIYIVQDGKLRLITSPAVYAALGYKPKYIQKEHPEFLRRYPHGHAIRAFRTVVDGNGVTKGGPAPAPSTSATLRKVRPAVRALINEVNTLYIQIFDKDVTPSENKFWVDYIYNGEVNNKADLIAKMKTAKETGKKPSRTSRTAVISGDKLKSHWFPYLFYFVWQKEPSSEDRAYWYSRIDSDRNTIEKLGGTIQWTKDNLGTTRR